MDINITQNIELFALIAGLLGFYFNRMMPVFHAWIDDFPDKRENVWKRATNAGTEKFAPNVRNLTTNASKLVAPIIVLFASLFFLLTPLGYFSLFNEIADILNYFLAVPASMILLAIVKQWWFLRSEKAKRKLDRTYY